MAFITIETLTDFANKFAAKITEKFAKKTDIPDIPENAKFTDTVYTHPTTEGNKHIPAGGESGQILRWSAAGTAAWGDDNNTTYSPMTGATVSAAGSQGLVPAPPKGNANRFLCSDATFKEIAEATTEDIDAIIAGTFSNEGE